MATDKSVYNGPERRKGERRKIPDRRVEIRYEPEKLSRRSGKDRRRNGKQDIWDRRDL